MAFTGMGDVTGQITGGQRSADGKDWQFTDQRGNVLTAMPLQDFYSQYGNDMPNMLQKLGPKVNGVDVWNPNAGASSGGSGATPSLYDQAGGAKTNTSSGGGYGASQGPTSSDPTMATATTGSVGDDELVAKQLTRLLDSNSPYVDQARQRAIQLANARGLQNSTLAGSAGEEAAISQALPIAQQDAGTYNKQNLTNQDALNKASLFNASQALEGRKLSESARQFDASLSFDQKKLLEQARQFDSTLQFEGTKLSEQSKQFYAGLSQDDKKLIESARQFDQQNTLEQAKLDEAKRQADADNALKDRLAQLDSQTKLALADTEAKYKTLMQSSASASDLWRQYLDAVTKIMGDDTLDQPNKQAALDLLANQLQQGMTTISKINGLNLGDILGTDRTPAVSGLPQTNSLYEAPPPPPNRSGAPQFDGTVGGGN